MRLNAHIARVGLVVVLGLALAAPVAAKSELDVGAALAERIVGNPAAPVTIVEYASFTCPLCAAFHISADYDGLIERYIKPGRVKLIYRDFPLDGVSLRASIAARCADPQNYFDLVRQLYRTQRDWAEAENPTAALAKITGLDASMLNACLASPAMRDGLFRIRQQGTDAGVLFTPTYIVNGTMFSGILSFQELSEILDPLVADN